jgi:hypothetical protein
MTGRHLRTPLQETLIALVLIGVTGCGRDGPVRYDVDGTLRFDGRPIPAGLIHFDPDTSQGNDGPQGFAFIKDGRYDTRLNGKGSVGGPHIARISAFDGVNPTDDGPFGRLLFASYSTSVDLPGEDETFDFDVPASAAPR